MFFSQEDISWCFRLWWNNSWPNFAHCKRVFKCKNLSRNSYFWDHWLVNNDHFDFFHPKMAFVLIFKIWANLYRWCSFTLSNWTLVTQQNSDYYKPILDHRTNWIIQPILCMQTSSKWVASRFWPKRMFHDLLTSPGLNSDLICICSCRFSRATIWWVIICCASSNSFYVMVISIPPTPRWATKFTVLVVYISPFYYGTTTTIDYQLIQC